MGYACPVCDLPQHDAEHLANHLAMTALTHGDEHEDWLDDHVAGWSEESPATLGDRVAPHAEEVPHETVFEDTTGGHDHGHGSVDVPTGAGAAPAADTEAVRTAVEEARRMRAETAESGDEADESATEGVVSDDDAPDPTTEGHFAPATVAEARAAYESCAPAAKVVVRETARAMGVDRAEYRERVTSEVIETARDAIFASFLRVHAGSREAFEAWRADYDGEVTETGSPDVERVAWHVAPTGAVATTFHADREAAVGTLRRQAFGRLYRPAFEGDGADDDTAPDA